MEVEVVESGEGRNAEEFCEADLPGEEAERAQRPPDTHCQLGVLLVPGIHFSRQSQGNSSTTRAFTFYIALRVI